jgi:hypothetical protein
MLFYIAKMTKQNSIVQNLIGIQPNMAKKIMLSKIQWIKVPSPKLH